MQHTAILPQCIGLWLPLLLRYCNTLQSTATPCSTLQHSATLCNTLQHAAIWLTMTNMNCGNLCVWMRTRTKAHACTHMYMHKWAYTHMYTYVCIFTQIRMQLCSQICGVVRICVYIRWNVECLTGIWWLSTTYNRWQAICHLHHVYGAGNI